MNKFGAHMVETDWYLAQLKPNGQAAAERNLHRQGFETFMPRQAISRRRGTKFVDTLAPLFPGYLFVALNAASYPWRRVNGTYGVSRIVSFGDTPRPLPRDLVEDLRRRCRGSDVLEPSRTLTPGDEVEILSGPFSQFIARIEALSPGDRVWALIDMMGQETRVALSAAQVAPR